MSADAPDPSVGTPQPDTICALCGHSYGEHYGTPKAIALSCSGFVGTPELKPLNIVDDRLPSPEAAEARELVAAVFGEKCPRCGSKDGQRNPAYWFCRSCQCATTVGTPQPDDDLRCGGCGGPHRFDTSVPSVLWNRVIRPLGGSEYLCTACIVSAFARAGVSFTATLYGDGFHGLPIAIEINGQTSTVAHEIQEENNALRGTLSRIHDEAEAQLASACRPPDSKNVGTPPSADDQTVSSPPKGTSKEHD